METNGGEGSEFHYGENNTDALRLPWATLNGIHFIAQTQQEAAKWVESLLIIDSRGVHDNIHNMETIGGRYAEYAYRNRSLELEGKFW